MSKPLNDLFRQWHECLTKNYLSMNCHYFCVSPYTHYFCAFPHTFDKGCQVINLHKGDVLWKVAEQWMKANGYKHCYVYDANHNFVWSFDSKDV